MKENAGLSSVSGVFVVAGTDSIDRAWIGAAPGNSQHWYVDFSGGAAGDLANRVGNMSGVKLSELSDGVWRCEVITAEQAAQVEFRAQQLRAQNITTFGDVVISKNPGQRSMILAADAARATGFGVDKHGRIAVRAGYCAAEWDAESRTLTLRFS